jgi:hypothetical protein
MPASTFRPSAPNSGPRWSIVGRLIARRMRRAPGSGRDLQEVAAAGMLVEGQHAKLLVASNFCIQNSIVNRIA